MMLGSATVDSRHDGPLWRARLLSSLSSVTSSGPYAKVFSRPQRQSSACGIHLAVLVEPYLSLILDGKKTIESRFSVNRHAPFEQVQRGDVVILKRSSGPVEGLCTVSDAWFYRLNPNTWPEIERYASALCMDDSSFWRQKRGASYASLMRIEKIVRVPSLEIGKLDPRGWVVLRSRPLRGQQCLF
jgi:hypothetical protein